MKSISGKVTVIPAMVQQRWANNSVLEYYPTGVLTAGTAEKQICEKGVAHLWKNEGVAPLRELLYSYSASLADEEWKEGKIDSLCFVRVMQCNVLPLSSTQLVGLSWVQGSDGQRSFPRLALCPRPSRLPTDLFVQASN